MNAPLGKNLEAACMAYAYRSAVQAKVKADKARRDDLNRRIREENARRAK
jgi:hypothetical protein